MSKVAAVVVVHESYLKHLPTTLRTIPRRQWLDVVVVGNGCDGEGVTLPIQETTLAAACNLGIASTDADYIVRVDADDFIEPALLEIERAYLDDYLVDAVWCDYWKALERKSAHHSVWMLDYYPQEELEHACGVMYRREVWERLKYREDLEYQESFDFWLRFRKAGFRAERVEIPLYFYRQHQSMSSNIEARERVRQEILHGQD